MSSNVMSINWTTVLSGALGIAATLFVVAYLAGWRAPFIVTDRAAFYALAAVGFSMCTLSMGRTTTGLGWTHPIPIAGVILGVLILLLVVTVMAGWHPPFIPSDRAAFLAVAAAGLVKWGLAIFSRVVLKV
jgi:hypothetical protein